MWESECVVRIVVARNLRRVRGCGVYAVLLVVLVKEVGEGARGFCSEW